MVEDVLLGQSVEEVLCLLIRGDELLPVLRVRQIDHPGGVALDDFISLGIAEHGGHHVRYFCTVASWMGLPWWVRFLNSISIFSRAWAAAPPA